MKRASDVPPVVESFGAFPVTASIAEESEAISGDPDIDADAVHVLPGTGGPDDVGDVEDVPDDYNPTGKPGGATST